MSQSSALLQQSACRRQLSSKGNDEHMANDQIISLHFPRLEEGKKITHRFSTQEMKDGEKLVLCRCWLSKTFPLCDGAHGNHNRATGDTVGPVIVTIYSND